MNTAATFRLWGNTELTAAAVTDRLALQPTTAAEAGALSGRRVSMRRERSLWALSATHRIEFGVELDTQLLRLLSELEPVTAMLWALVETGYEAEWYCWIESHATEHAVELNRQLLKRLLTLPGDLWLDVCGDDSDTFSGADG